MSKRVIRPLVCILLVLSAVFVFAACGGGDKGETTPSGNSNVTFDVNGVKTTVTVKAGEMPVYTGETEWEDSEHFYRILGWDKEFVPAAGDVTYTANVGVYGLELVDVLWKFNGDVITTQVHIGETPTAPKVDPTYQTKEKVYTFTGEWAPAITAATAGRNYFEAQYTSTARLYDITFVVDGKTVEAKTVAYGETPTAPQVSIPSGYSFVSWGTLAKVDGDATYTATFTNMEPTVYELVVKALSSGYGADRANAALLVSLEESKKPGQYGEFILSYLRWVIAGGNEPEFDFTPNFYQPMVSAAIAVAKSIDSVWSQLTQAEVERLDLLMKCMAVQSAIATDDSCNYTSGPGGKGDYNKGWNPNYPLSNVTQIIFCVSYFGSANATNQVLKDFDYDTYIAKFKEYGWTKVLAAWTRNVVENADGSKSVAYRTAGGEGLLQETWYGKVISDDGNGHLKLEITTSSEDIRAQTYGNLGLGFVEGTKRTIDYTTPKAMLMEGGPVYAMTALYRISQYVGKPCGTGIGVPAIGAKGYSYKGYDLTKLEGIWNSLLNYNYSGGIVASKEVKRGDEYLCYIYDGTKSPVEGLYGMMKEFRSGERSSVIYCQVDFVMCVASTAAMSVLDIYDTMSKSNESTMLNVWVGNTDFLYKAEHGYVSYTGTAVRGDPEPEYGSGLAYRVFAYYWNENGAKEHTLDEFEFPDLNANVVDKENAFFTKDNGNPADPNFTMNLGSTAGSVAKDKNYWENDFFLSFSMYYSQYSPADFELRLRGSASNQRFAIMYFSLEKGGFVLTSATPADENSPEVITLGEEGWHRITVQYHQGAVANDDTQTVSFTVALTVYVDGVKVGTYNDYADAYMIRGWLLYGASYSATAENHIAYSKYTPTYTSFSGPSTWVEGQSINNPYFQIYRGGFYNNPSQHWLFSIGDIKTYCGTAPEANVAAVSYVLNGGEIAKDRKITATGGYQTEYMINNATYYVSAERGITAITPVRDGYVFAGWYDNENLTGARVAKLSTKDGQPITLYAAWAVDDTPVDAE